MINSKNTQQYTYKKYIFLRFFMALAFIVLFFFNSNKFSGNNEYGNDLLYMKSELVIPTNNSFISVRQGPGFIYPVVKSLDSCNALTVIEKGLWYKIRYDNSYGYVYSASFIDSEAYEPDRLGGFVIGIDPDGQKELNSFYESVSPLSSQVKEKMTERNVGTITGSFDYDINNTIALKLKKALIEDGATVILTRDTSDINMSNKERAEYLNSENCNIIIRISCEFSHDSMDSGVSVYISKLSAETDSVKLADYVIKHLSKQLNIAKAGVNVLNDNSFLNWSKATAVQVEIGYLSNLNDEKKLLSDNYQQEIAKALKKAVVSLLYEKK